MNGQINLGDISVTRYFGLVAVVAGLLFALIDGFPAGFSAGLLHVIQWQLQALVPMTLLFFCQLLLGRLHQFDLLNPWVQLTLTAIVATAVFAPLALAIDIVFEDGNESFRWNEILDEYLATAPPVILFWLAINAPWLIGFRLVRKPAPERVAADNKPSFYKLIPPDMRGELVYLAAELHYLSVITTAGRCLILYNLRDAIFELPETMGLQTHRGYWVALAHIRELKRVGRQGALTLSNGDIIPVSRRNLAEVEAAFSAHHAGTNSPQK